MNLIEFNKIITQPGNLGKDKINELQVLVEQYPFFQAAHFLHLNGLKQQRSFKYNNYLKKTAAYTTDRTVLFDNITAASLDIHPAPSNRKPDSAQGAEKEAEAMPLDVPESTVEEASPEATLKIGQPLEFKQDETYSFREWLNLSAAAPIDRTTTGFKDQSMEKSGSVEKEEVQPSKTDLIDKFIASSPKINPSLYDNYTDIAKDSLQENESLMTETLAHVYVEQKKYKKAIMAFTILSLKYPKKSSFFAHQIEAVKKLQEK